MYFHKNTKNLPLPLEVRKTHRGPTPHQGFLMSQEHYHTMQIVYLILYQHNANQYCYVYVNGLLF